MADLDAGSIWQGSDDGGDMINESPIDDIRQRTRLLDNEIRVMQGAINTINHETKEQRAKINDNKEKIKTNRSLPYLVSNVVEIVDADDEEDEDIGAAQDMNTLAHGEKGVVIKTTTRQTIYLPVPGLVHANEVRPGELVGVNKDSFIMLEKLPPEFDSRVKAFEVDEKPTEDYSDIGGLEKQIQELIEAVVLPMTQADRFKSIGIRPPKGVLLYGPPGTGKTMMARACAKSTDSVFLKLAGPQLVQMYVGDGAKLIRDAFDLAKDLISRNKSEGAIIFIDEIDAIGGKRGGGGEHASDREVQRTMLELLNQLDGFSSTDKIKVIAATNRPDVLDPALLRSGRLDRKIELPNPREDARAAILRIHSNRMKVDFSDLNLQEIAKMTEDFNGAQLKAVCVEAGMIALRRDARMLKHEDYVEAVSVVSAKKKGSLEYYA